MESLPGLQDLVIRGGEVHASYTEWSYLSCLEVEFFFWMSTWLKKMKIMEMPIGHRLQLHHVAALN